MPLFAHSAGPGSWKQFLHPPRRQLWSAGPDGDFRPAPPAWSAPWKWSTRSGKYCASSTATSGPGSPRWRYGRAPGTGHGFSEAPRGVLYHRYTLDADGLIRAATIIPPTSQNQAAIENDLRRVAEANLGLDDAALTSLCERVIRNYDPCISCAAHFLTLRVNRG
jgi:hypothetical protein